MFPLDPSSFASALKNDMIRDLIDKLNISAEDMYETKTQINLNKQKIENLESSLKLNTHNMEIHLLDKDCHITIESIKKYSHLIHMSILKQKTDSRINVKTTDKFLNLQQYIPHTICNEDSKYSGIADIIIPKSTQNINEFLKTFFQQASTDGKLHSWTFLPGVYELDISSPSSSYFCNYGLNFSYSPNWIYTGIDATFKIKDNASSSANVDVSKPTAVLLTTSSLKISGFIIDGNMNNNTQYENIVGIMHGYLSGKQSTEFCTIINTHEGIRDMMQFNCISNNKIFAKNTGIKILNFNSIVTGQNHKIIDNYILDADTGIEIEKTSSGNASNLICSNTILFSKYDSGRNKSIHIKSGNANILQDNYCKDQNLNDIEPSFDVSPENIIIQNSSGESNLYIPDSYSYF